MSDQVDAADLSGAVAALQAVEEIKQLKYRYVRACDLKEMDALIDCFAAGDILVDYESTGRFERAKQFAAAFAEISLRGGRRIRDLGDAPRDPSVHHVARPGCGLRYVDAALSGGQHCDDDGDRRGGRLSRLLSQDRRQLEDRGKSLQNAVVL